MLEPGNKTSEGTLLNDVGHTHLTFRLWVSSLCVRNKYALSAHFVHSSHCARPCGGSTQWDRHSLGPLGAQNPVGQVGVRYGPHEPNYA